MTLVIPVAFFAEDQADAERQALAWANAEPNIAEARVTEAKRRLGTSWWWVTLEVVMRGEPVQPELGLL